MKFEEFHLGQQFTSRPYTVVPREEMLAFARSWDPQPIHVDDGAAADGPFGQVIASGFLTAVLAWKLWIEIGAQGDDGHAGLSVENLVWRKPLFAGTTVQARIRIVEHRITKGGHGLVTFEFRLGDETDEEVASFRTTGLFHRNRLPAGETQRDGDA